MHLPSTFASTGLPTIGSSRWCSCCLCWNRRSTTETSSLFTCSLKPISSQKWWTSYRPLIGCTDGYKFMSGTPAVEWSMQWRRAGFLPPHQSVLCSWKMTLKCHRPCVHGCSVSCLLLLRIEKNTASGQESACIPQGSWTFTLIKKHAHGLLEGKADVGVMPAFWHQQPRSKGASYFPHVRQEFRLHLLHRWRNRHPQGHLSIPGSCINGCPSSWKKYIMELPRMQGFSLVYLNFPDQRSFSTSDMEPGEHISVAH